MNAAPVQKTAVAVVVGVVLGIHVVCTALYLLPQNPLTGYWSEPVQRYMEPLFAQRWLLFAPEPATNSLKLWSRYECDGTWTRWRDPAAPLLEIHQRNRLSPTGKLLYISNSLARDLSSTSMELALRLQCRDEQCETRRKAEVRRSAAFQSATRYALRSAPCAAPASLQFMVVQIYPVQFSERHKPRPFSFANATEFEPVVLRGKR